jgi:hypothetical protein
MLTSWPRWALAGAVVLVATLASAQQPFDIVLSGALAPAVCRITPIVTPAVEWIGPGRVDAQDVQQIASADGRRVFGIKEDTRIFVLTPDGEEQLFFAGIPGQLGLGLAVASSGRVFARMRSGLATSLAVISPTGVLENTYPVPEFDFAADPDGCTLFFSKENGVGRMNGCTGAPLPDLIAMPDVREIVALADGQVLVATWSSVVLVSASGSIVRTVATLDTYGLGDKFVGQIAARGDSLWIAVPDLCANQTMLLQVSLTDGAELSRREVELDFVNAIVIGAISAPIPTVSEWALLALAAALAAGGAVVLRWR